MFNLMFTFWRFFYDIQDFDVAEWCRNLLQSQYKHDAAFIWIQHTALLQYKLDSHCQFLHARHQNTGCPLLPKKPTWVKATQTHLSLQRSFLFFVFVFVFQFLYSVLGRCTCILASCWPGIWERHICSFGLFRENHYTTSCYTQLTEPVDVLNQYTRSPKAKVTL